MSSSAKFGFRPRALDVTKKLPIRIRKCRKRSPNVKRTAAITSSGMEKEEEMESHLQQAILAQKATSSGDTVTNHVIPTPKVSSLPDDEYERIYDERECQKGERRSKKYIVFRDYVPFFVTQNSYNADSEDEQWLSARRNVNIDDFEHIIAKLEIFSQTDIVKPRNARDLLHRYDSGLIEDVYDYWLQKRQKAASKKARCSILMPHLCTESKKEEKSVVNPYLAFRRRLDKVQTRKKQKTELMTYEKMLQINFAMKRSIVLANALTQREKLKGMAGNMEYSMFQLQYRKQISNEEVDEITKHVKTQQRQDSTSTIFDKMQPSTSQTTNFDLPQESKPKTKVEITLSVNSFPNEKFLQKNVEFWNSAALITPAYATSAVNDDFAETEKIAAVDQNSIVDGRYHFKRKHGCRYRAPLEVNALTPPQQSTTNELNPFHCFTTRFTQERYQLDGSIVQKTGFMRKRIGRGGRLLVDLYFP